MIKRDQTGIICQHDPNNPAYMDGGDSANRTGHMALAGSKLDQSNLVQFYVPTFFGFDAVRHPHQVEFNDPRTFSRDQLTPYIAGLSTINRYAAGSMLISRLFHCFFAQNYWSGTDYKVPDLIGPDAVWHMIVCAHFYPFYPFAVIGIPWMILSIIYNTRFNPTGEQNPIIAMCIVQGQWACKLYLALHPNPKAQLDAYWAGWRDQHEIGDAIWAKLNAVANG